MGDEREGEALARLGRLESESEGRLVDGVDGLPGLLNIG